MTFPITNLIFSTTNASVTSHEWTVPNVSSTQARLRVLAATKAGSAIEVKSGKFTIAGDGASLIPRIVSAEVIGKHLYVDGVNLKEGAKVEMDGVTQKTSFETDSATEATSGKSDRTRMRMTAGQMNSHLAAPSERHAPSVSVAMRAAVRRGAGPGGTGSP